MKVAISVPDPVFGAAERVSRRLKISRSELYSKAVAAYVKKHGRDDVTERLNSVYGSADAPLDPALETMALEVLRRNRW
jgi:metal-responsive CopG/Arc/MetJ family transcriptional regulator